MIKIIDKKTVSYNQFYAQKFAYLELCTFCILVESSVEIDQFNEWTKTLDFVTSHQRAAKAWASAYAKDSPEPLLLHVAYMKHGCR